GKGWRSSDERGTWRPRPRRQGWRPRQGQGRRRAAPGRLLPPAPRLQVLRGEDRLHQLQGRAPADAVPPRARQDPAAPDLGDVCHAPAQAADRNQARAPAGARAVRHGLGTLTRFTVWGCEMEVILREHVDNLGRRGDIVKVAEGYARNYLLPR